MFDFVFREIPLKYLEQDPEQPRKNFGTEGDKNRLFLSVRNIGIQQPLVVSEVEENRFIILDGHRRYQCAQRLELATVPCRVYPKLDSGDFAYIRFEVQNNRRPWKPLERSDALNSIKESKGFRSNRDLAKHLHISEDLVSNSLQLRNQKIEHIILMERYDLEESYRTEFIHLKPKLRKIKEFEVDQIICNLCERVQQGVIKNAKDFRKLGKIFLRAKANEEQIYSFLSNPDMTVKELDLQNPVQTGFSLLLEEVLSRLTDAMTQTSTTFSDGEKNLITKLRNILNTMK